MHRQPSQQRYTWLPWLLAAMLGSTVVIGALVLRYAEEHLLLATANGLTLLAADLADKLDQTLFERYADLQIAKNHFVDSARDARSRAQYLSRLKDTYHHYQWLGVTDAHGRITAATDPRTVGQDNSGTNWFQATRDSSEFDMQDIAAIDRREDIRAMRFSARITGAQGEFLGVITALIGDNEVFDIAARTITVYQARQSDNRRIEWQLISREGVLLVDSLLREEGVNLLHTGLPSARLSAGDEPGFIIETHGRRHTPVLTGYAQTHGYEQFPDLQWRFLVRMDQDDVLAPIRELQRHLLMTTGGVFVPVFALLMWSTSRLRTEWMRVQEEHTLLLHTLNAIVWQADPADFRITYISPQVERILGYSSQQCLTQQVTWRDLIHPEDIEQVVATCRVEVMAGKSHDLEYRTCRADGRVIWIKNLVTVVMEQGRPVKVQGIIVDITKQKMSEQAEAATRKQLADIIGSVTDGIVSVDADQRIVLFNTTAEEIFRCPATDALGQPLDRFIPQRFRATHHTRFDALAKSDQPVPLKRMERMVVGLRGDGEEFPANIALSSVHTLDGWRHTAVVRDMTEQVRTDRARHLQYAIAQILAESTTTQQAITSVMKAICNGMGWAAGAYWCVDTQDETLHLVECCTGPESRLEEFKRVTQQSRWRLGVGLPGRVWSTGQATWMPDVAQDSTLPRTSVAADANLHGAVGFPVLLGRKIVGIMEFFSEQTLQPDQELLQTLTGIGSQIGILLERKHAESRAIIHLQAMEAAVEAIILGDLNGVITYANPAAAHMFGYETEELVGRPAHILYPENVRAEQFSSILAAALETGWSGEVAGLRKDGTPFPRWVSVSPILDVIGHSQGVVSVSRDLTETKLMEAHAWRLQRLATLGQLLGGIAHEIKNPLFIMTGRLQLLAHKLAQQDYAAVGTDLEKIEAAAERMKTIAERFLTIARPIPPHKEFCSVEAILQEVLGFLANELMKNQIRVEPLAMQRLPRIMSDPGQLHEVFLNLILNAMQAMAEAHGQGTLCVVTALVAEKETVGGIITGDDLTNLVVRASVTGEDNKGEWVEVRIQDDGPGIAPEHRAKLFEPFFSTKPPGKGTGLGLWAVRSILMTLKGTVRYETEVGRGTAFIVRLPVTDAWPYQEEES